VFSERQLSVGSALIVGELDFKDAGGKRLDDCSDLATQQPIAGQIGSEGDDIEQLNLVHLKSPVYQTSNYNLEALPLLQHTATRQPQNILTGENNPCGRMVALPMAVVKSKSST